MNDLSDAEGSVESDVEKPRKIISVNNVMNDLSDAEGSVESDVEEKPRKMIPVNNVGALRAKSKAIEQNFDWIEKLDITVNVEEQEHTPVDSIKDMEEKAENDFQREMSFYNQALSSVTKAFKRLRKLGIATKRPSDFMAEMAKSDAHMNKVREKLLSKQTAVERREQVRAIREQKKQGKKVQQEIIRERKSEKKKMINALKKTKKGKMGADAVLGQEKKVPASKPQKGKKFREFRDSKYGYGGKKKGSKWNTSESSAGDSQRGNQGKRNFKDKKFGKNNRRGPQRRRR